MKKSKVTRVAVERLDLNTGQLGWLPKNPRQWSQQDIDRMRASLAEDPDFPEERPVLAVQGPDGRLVVFAHNLLVHVVKLDGELKTVPCVIHEAQDEADQETIRRRALKDNGGFGSWDTDILANDWEEFTPEELVDMGLPDWTGVNARTEMENGGLSSRGKEGAEGYDAFVDKFKPKLTTDDCYTPPAVFEVVRKFVDEQIQKLDGVEVMRPFFPGGNYEDLTQYTDGCVVLDNPPFSILSKILRFYHEHGIKFFLFGPHLTLFSAPDIAELTYLPVCAPVEYENGAVVSTGFITNMTPGLKIWIPAGFRHTIREVQRDTEPINEYLIPPCVVTSSRLGTIAGVKGCELKITAEECAYIKNLDAMAEAGKGLYGGGGM